LSEIVSLLKNSDNELTYYNTNNSPGTLVSIPHSSNQHSFNNQLKKDNWINHIIKANTHQRPEIKKEESAHWFIDYFFRTFEAAFTTVAKKKGLIKIEKMNAVQAAAMWSEANVPQSSAQVILRHLRIAFGFQIVVPKTLIKKIGTVPTSVSPPVFGTYNYINKEQSVRDIITKKTEIVSYWTADLCEMFEADYERMYESEVNKINRLGRKKRYKFGYPSPLIDSSETTVDVIIGGDHGAGAFRLLGKINFLSSKQRKIANHIEHGSRVFQFGNIQCKKDTRDIISLLSPVVNDIINKLKGGMLVGILDAKKHAIKCVFLPKTATNLHTTNTIADNSVYLTWNEGSVLKRKKLDGLAVEGVKKIWNIIENFTYFVTRDLAFYATILGRDGTAPSRCPWCDLSSKQWKADPTREGNILTYHNLSHYASLLPPPTTNHLGQLTSTTNPTAPITPPTTNPLDNTTSPIIPRTSTNPAIIINTPPTPTTTSTHTNPIITTTTNRTPIITQTPPIPPHITPITNPTVITPPRRRTQQLPDLKGVKEAPLWIIDPSRCITPLLHLEIGLFSRSWKTLQLYLDEKVELIPLVEQELRKEMRILMNKDENMKEIKDDLIIQKSRTYVSRKEYQHEYDVTTAALRPSLGQPLLPLDLRRELKLKKKELNKLVKDLWKSIKSFTTRINELEKEIVENNIPLHKVKKRCVDLRKKRVGSTNGLDTVIDQMLKREANIYREAYHGGDLNGVCVRRFLEQSSFLMDNITALVCERRNEDNGRVEYDNRCEEEELKTHMSTYRDLYSAMDLVFSLLRVPAPNSYDIKNVKKAVARLEQLWRKLGINETPKAHIMFKHTVQQYELFGGIADKAEDFVEKSHQVGKRLDYLTNRLPSGGYKRKQLLHFKRMWMQQDPCVIEQIHQVHTSRKRKIRHPSNKSISIKRECRLLLREKTKKKIDNETRRVLI
jgi:hypothetical protein